MIRLLFFIMGALLTLPTWAGTQREEALSANVASTLRRSVADVNAPRLVFDNPVIARTWLNDMSTRLARRLPDPWVRERMLIAIHYEATRAGLDPQLLLGVIQVESGFNKYAISKAGARGLMQVMPFWVRVIGKPEHNLFDLTTNLRYGATILRHYLDIEKGNLFRALGRYNGSLGKPEYPNLVFAAWKNRWDWQTPRLIRTTNTSSFLQTSPTVAP